MKKTTILRIAILLAVCTVFALALPSCTRKYIEIGAQSETETGTVEAETHKAPATSEKPTEAPTEKATEPPTEKQTEEKTEPKTEEPQKEPVKEPEPVTPQPSLQYLSYGNGTCSVAGIGTYTDPSVIIPSKSPSGDIVTAIEPKAFYENDNIKTVQIPSTVTSIGEMAFSGCTQLVYIVVDSTNRSYRDINGVLYDKDRTTLIAYPAANQSTTLELSSKITTIADMALYGCTNLKNIVFDGSPSEWERLNIGTLNYSLFSATVTFTDSDK
jgi:hypothetical protein